MSKFSYIFICGVSRTGSKFYSQLLNSHEDVSVCPELLIRHPYKEDFTDLVNKKLRENPSAKELSEYVVNLNIKDTYNRVVSEVDNDELTRMLDSLSVVTPMEIFRSLMYLRSADKPILGAKFPLHYRYSNQLLEYFPKSGIIFLTRDPRDIYCSDVKNKRRRFQGAKSFPLVSLALKPIVLFYTMLEWKSSLVEYTRLLSRYGSDRVKLFRYEEISAGLAPHNVADFLRLNVNEFDLKSIERIDSSFSGDSSTVNWEDRLNRVEKLIFKACIGRKMRKFEYY